MYLFSIPRKRCYSKRDLLPKSLFQIVGQMRVVHIQIVFQKNLSKKMFWEFDEQLKESCIMNLEFPKHHVICQNLILWGGELLLFRFLTMKIFRFIYDADSDDFWCERELDYVLILKNFCAKINFNPDEISETTFVDQQTLTSMMKSNSQLFSPWFRLLFEQGWIEKWWKNLDNLSTFSNPLKITKLNQ